MSVLCLCLFALFCFRQGEGSTSQANACLVKVAGIVSKVSATFGPRTQKYGSYFLSFCFFEPLYGEFTTLGMASVAVVQLVVYF